VCTSLGGEGWFRPSAKFRTIGVVGVLLLAGCAQHPSDEHALSESRQVALELERSVGFVDDPDLLAYLEDVGGRIIAQGKRDDIDYRFEILDMELPNALALPEGQIFVSRGLLVLVNSEDELAGILAHEIAHVEEEHASERKGLASATYPIRLGAGIAGWATGLVIPGLGDAIVELGETTSGLVLAPYSREQEHEADRVGQSLAAAAGYEPSGLVDLLETMTDALALTPEKIPEQSWFDTHPTTSERVELTREHAKTLSAGARPVSARDRDQVLAMLEGLVIGGDPSKGFFDENWFVHPELAFVMGFPPGWNGINSGGFVGAQKPEEETFVMLALVSRGSDPVEGAKAASKKLKADLASDAELGILNGLKAARNQLRVSDENGETQMLELTWIAYNGLIYQIMGVTNAERFAGVEEIMRKSAHSFRPLTKDELAHIMVVKLVIVEGQQGESIAELARRAGTTWTPRAIAVVNRKPLTETLKDGELMKVGIKENYAAAP